MCSTCVLVLVAWVFLLYLEVWLLGFFSFFRVGSGRFSVLCGKSVLFLTCVFFVF